MSKIHQKVNIALRISKVFKIDLRYSSYDDSFYLSKDVKFPALSQKETQRYIKINHPEVLL